MGLHLHDVVPSTDNMIMCWTFLPVCIFYNKTFGYEVKESGVNFYT